MGIEPIIYSRPTNSLAPCMPLNDEVCANLFGFPEDGFLTLPMLLYTELGWTRLSQLLTHPGRIRTRDPLI